MEIAAQLVNLAREAGLPAVGKGDVSSGRGIRSPLVFTCRPTDTLIVKELFTSLGVTMTANAVIFQDTSQASGSIDIEIAGDALFEPDGHIDLR